jgi:cell division protein FtsX
LAVLAITIALFGGCSGSGTRTTAATSTALDSGTSSKVTPCPVALVNVFFHIGASDAQISSVQLALQATGVVQQIRFVTSQVAFGEYKILIVDPSATGLLPSQVPPSLRVVPKTAAGAQILKAASERMPGVDQVAIGTAAEQITPNRRLYLDVKDLVRKLGDPGPPCR